MELLSLGGGGGILERSREMDLLSCGFDLDLLSPAFDLELLSPDFDAEDLCVRSRDTELLLLRFVGSRDVAPLADNLRVELAEGIFDPTDAATEELLPTECLASLNR